MKWFSPRCKAEIRWTDSDVEEWHFCRGYRGHLGEHYANMFKEWFTWKDTDLRAVRNGRGERLDD